MNNTTTTIKPPYEMPYTTTIDLVLTKGCEIKPIGKSGYTSEKVPSVSSKAPTIYRLRDSLAPDTVIDQYLSMAALKAGMKRRGLLPTKRVKKETVKEAYERGYAAGYAEALAWLTK
jgi:hypothetical protein